MTEWKVGDKVLCIKERYKMKPGEEGSIVKRDFRFLSGVVWWTVSFSRGSKDLNCPWSEMDEHFKKI